MIKIGNFKIRPEIEKPIYYIHVVIILAIYYGLMQLYNPNIFFIYLIYFIISDAAAHTILQLD
jgi:hypothetical protein